MLLPWDYASSLRTLERELTGRHIHHFNMGIANYWDSPLHRRFLLEEENRNLLTHKIEEIHSYLTPERISNQMDNYTDIIREFAFEMPDLMFLGSTPTQIEKIWTLLPHEINRNYRAYKDSLVMPTPFKLKEPYIDNGILYISWDESISFFRDNINYTIKINNDWNFDEPMFIANDIDSLQISLDILPDGIYYLKAIAYDDLGNNRPASNFIRSADGYYLDGVKMFIVRDGNRVIT